MSNPIDTDNSPKTDFNLESFLVMQGDQIPESVLAEINSLELLQAHYRLAKIFYDKADFLKAQKYFTLAAKYAEIPRDIYVCLKIYGFLTRIYSEQLESGKAQENIEKAEALLKDLPSMIGSLSSEYFYNLGMLHTYKGELREARENFYLSYSKSKEENEPEVLVKSLYSLAQSHFKMGEFDRTEKFLNQLNELLKILNKTYMQGTMHLLYGYLFAEYEQFDKALAHYREANRAFQKKNCWNLYGQILLGKGIVHRKMGEYNKAVLYFELALDSCDNHVYRKLSRTLGEEILDIKDSTVDLYLDRTNRVVHEKRLGTIDFKHRFVLLEILFLLARNPGTYYDKEELAKLVWKDEYNPLIHDKLIYTSVSRLRKLIEPKGEKRTYILRGKEGYTFNPLVKTRFQGSKDVKSVSEYANIELTSPI